MKRNPKVCVLRTAGTNCDKETAFAFVQAGADAELVHINKFIQRERNFSDYEILAIPGGFSYGDDVAAGKILANELRTKLIDDLRQFIQDGKLIIGICNGFQILVKSGLLPGNDMFEQEVSLVINDSGKFEDRWVYLKSKKSKVNSQKCVWTKHLPEVIYLPVAHGEGKFIVQDETILKKLKDNNEVVFQYCDEAGKLAGYPDNPNGSLENIAGITDQTGRILGLMPHPERHISVLQHPRWMGKKEGDGLRIFKNGVDYIRNHF
ncbi:MAG: phosphoribosylformylglycinamidine synthase I [Candidatus Omnitrophica bacterium]|jgi:phosphoribosylformylglycinamidine synthase|nr:phosphoribosylformylglycinamidine synthase I [Candidatus Omnitrophota bacterium]